MKCSIISVGTELLIGQIANTNSVYLSQQLNDIGISVLYHYTVGDNEFRLENTLKDAWEKSDIIITTGGLGPTQDDLTKETIALYLDVPLIMHEPSYKKLLLYFNKFKRPMTKNNIKQSYLPKGCKVLENTCGTAPGFIVEKDGKIIISLPGPPKEMVAMFQNDVREYLRSRTTTVIRSKILRLFGIGESELESILYELITNQTNPTIATYAKEGEVSIRVTANAPSVDVATELLDSTINIIKKKIGKYIFSYNNEDLKEIVSKILVNNNLSISLAESCTGGLLASYFTEIPGISAVFDRSLVTYSNSAKIHELNVNKDTLFKFGAVSEETAREMVLGLKKKTDSDICIAITGIAGPDGGSEYKPVGTVYISILYRDNLICNKYNIWGDRKRVRNYSCLLALNMIRNIINNQ